MLKKLEEFLNLLVSAIGAAESLSRFTNKKFSDLGEEADTGTSHCLIASYFDLLCATACTSHCLIAIYFDLL